uniref:Uncharacterized protein n=1 Tax=uncultured prokaryote TaxID=198431 RepID=A0A0H5Q2W0_9ZZZZ|nr:hypothetical protein [uncultured prokaryote]
MNFDETIRLQALRLKQLNTQGHTLGDSLVDAMLKDAPEGTTRNICAAVAPGLFDEVNGVCDMLEISKRRFVEMALIDAIAKASTILAEVSPFVEEQPC